MKLFIPDPSLVVLIGVMGAGKSAFARRHFAPDEIVAAAPDAAPPSDEDDVTATPDAFDNLLYAAIAKRLAAGRLTVVDAANVWAARRQTLVALARRSHLSPIAVVLDTPEEVCRERNSARPERAVDSGVLRRQYVELRSELRHLRREGFRDVYILSSPDAAAAVVERRPLPVNRTGDCGPFDVIGDLHGCCDELAVCRRERSYGVRDRGTAVEVGCPARSHV